MLLQKIYSDKTYVAWRVTKPIQQEYMFSENEGPSPSMCGSARAPNNVMKPSWLKFTTPQCDVDKERITIFHVAGEYPKNCSRKSHGLEHSDFQTFVDRPASVALLFYYIFSRLENWVFMVSC
jgi:hypothetical protein